MESAVFKKISNLKKNPKFKQEVDENARICRLSHCLLFQGNCQYCECLKKYICVQM